MHEVPKFFMTGDTLGKLILKVPEFSMRSSTRARGILAIFDNLASQIVPRTLHVRRLINKQKHLVDCVLIFLDILDQSVVANY